MPSTGSTSLRSLYGGSEKAWTMWKWNLPTTSQHHRQRQRLTNNLWRGANEKSNRMSVEGRAENRVSPAPSAGELPRQPLPATRTPPKPARERETAPPPTTTITVTATPAQTVDMRWNQRHPRLYHRRWNYFAVRLQPRPRQKKTAPAEPTPQPEPTPALTAASDIPKQPPRKPWRGGGVPTRPHRHQHGEIIDYWKLIGNAKHRYDNGTFALILQLRGKSEEMSYLTFDQATSVRGEGYLLLYPRTPEYQ